MICENLRRRFSTHCCCRGVERQHRLGLVNTALGLESFRPLLVLNARGKSLPGVRYVVESAIRDHGVEVLFLDSISRSGSQAASPVPSPFR